MLYICYIVATLIQTGFSPSYSHNLKTNHFSVNSLFKSSFHYILVNFIQHEVTWQIYLRANRPVRCFQYNSVSMKLGFKFSHVSCVHYHRYNSVRTILWIRFSHVSVSYNHVHCLRQLAEYKMLGSVPLVFVEQIIVFIA